MGIKGLQSFVQNSCLNVCSMVSLKLMAERHKSFHPDCIPTIVVDAMGCLRTWYTPYDWIHGGQWKEYVTSLENFIAAFDNAGIKLVFVFDGVIEQKKRAEWAKRRLRDQTEVCKIFSFLKSSGQQPSRNMFFIPSGIATFTRFALKSLGQKILCTHVEGDYEAAAYAIQHNCFGILGEDSDYLIFNTVPYFSINKLCLDSLVTLMYRREILCEELGLHVSDLPLLASLLGNDIVAETNLEDFHRKCMAFYHSKRKERNRRANVIRSVAFFISSTKHKQDCLKELQKMLSPGFDMALLQQGIESYVLPEQTSPWNSQKLKLSGTTMPRSIMLQDPEIVQIALDEHYRGESTMICNIICTGESDCSNTLEDENDPEIHGQAVIFKAARQHIYAVLLGTGNGSADTCPIVSEWYVYHGNHLQKPDLVPAAPLSIPGGTPTARSLWLSEDPDIQRRRFFTCMACFHGEKWAEELRNLETHLSATCCLLIYLGVQVDSLSLTDVEAFLAQALCLQGKSASWLKSLQLPYVDSRAVHLAFLFLRGLITLMGANCACGYPFTMMDLMPWNTFDGKFFHLKYLLCHGQKPLEEIIEGNEMLIAQFQKLKTLITDACAEQGRNLHSNPRGGSCPFPGGSGGVFSGERQFHQYAHMNENQDHNKAFYPQTSYQGQSPHFGLSSEYEGTGGNCQGMYDYDRGNRGQRSSRRGKRGRGHQFSNQWHQ
ncbi:constitutive coactivator of peroxisome proliferator-activated receptor gamma isoform X3 [Hyperolius riggenbachi]|uniref:constitutive coactivator of peroxisome proliferator-activated receptor gamma isoform X3 n=1 Tax=Hyperolius riggenbachi TaxID=752182 RepID=UPI0035A37800